MKNNKIMRIKRLLWLLKNIFHKYSKEEKGTIKANKKLIKEFPFLLPRNRFDGGMSHDYDYTYTELDSMPEGWRESFGIEMCDRIKKCLLKADYLDKYRVLQIKEKFGTLRWYDAGVPKSISDEFNKIICYYENKSSLTCFICGKPTKYVTTGWISYICEKHFIESIGDNPNLEYEELTWSHIPSRTQSTSGKETRVESELKGEMMCTWKRYSKHNTILHNKNKDLIEDKETDAVSKTGLW